MGSGSSPQPQYISPPNPPAIAKNPPNQYYYQNGDLQSSVVQNGSNSYAINQFQTPDQQQIQKQSTNLISGLIPQLSGQFGNLPQAEQTYAQNYAAPQNAAINRSYDQALGQATNNAGGAGTQNSVGFQNFAQNQIERNRSQDLANVQANASNASYQLPSQMISPYADLFNIYNGALNGQQSQAFNNLNPVQQQSQVGASLSNAAANRYAPQLYTPPYQPGFLGLF